MCGSPTSSIGTGYVCTCQAPEPKDPTGFLPAGTGATSLGTWAVGLARFTGLGAGAVGAGAGAGLLGAGLTGTGAGAGLL